MWLALLNCVILPSHVDDIMTTFDLILVSICVTRASETVLVMAKLCIEICVCYDFGPDCLALVTLVVTFLS